jgi:hypothetical protein
MRTSRLPLRVVLLLSAVLVARPSAVPRAARPDIPAQLSDAEFWRLSDSASEPGGTFHSENYVSNEGLYQMVIPELLQRTRPGGLYLGVGPEQNFTYIAALRPDLVIILDVRRGNLHEHLLYKAMFEMSASRAEFISRLFARRRPAGLTASTPVADLFAAFAAVPRNDAWFQQNRDALVEWLTVRHHLPLAQADIDAIVGIYRDAFAAEGTNLAYERTDGSPFRGPTYAMLMARDDGTGTRRSFLATEANFLFLKNLQSRNLVVPVVGDFGGPKALRAIGAYARGVGARVSAFYVSNVEQYLRQEPGKMAAFCASVALLPLDAHSTFIRSVAGGGGRGEANNLAFFGSNLGSMDAETRACRAR